MSRDRIHTIRPGTLVLVPSSVAEQETQFGLGAWKDQVTILAHPVGRPEIVETIERKAHTPIPNPDLFFSLGFAFWQTHLMTKQVRHGGDLDYERFRKSLVAAALAAREQRDSEMRDGLRQAFDLLLTEKNRFYVSQPRLIDLTIASRDVKPESMVRQLRCTIPHMNWYLDSGHLSQLTKSSPGLLNQLTEAFEQGRITLLGGTARDWPQTMVSTASVVHDFLRGRETCLKLFSLPPALFARRKGGLHAQLPQFLRGFEFLGALHVSLDGSIVPRTGHDLIEWESPSRDSVPALSMQPLDAASAESWVSLGLELGRQLNSAHQATVLFAHWPGHYHPAFHDLLNLTRQSPLLGNWVSVEEALSSAYHPGYGDAFGCDEYRTPILEQSVKQRTQSPISTWIDYWRGTAQCRALEGLAAMLEAVTKNASAIRLEINDLRLAIDEQVDLDGTAREGFNADATYSSLHARLIRDLMQALGLSDCDQPDQATWLLFNPTGCSRLGAPPWGFHCASASEHSSAPNSTTSQPSRRTESLLWSHGLCNRHFELEIDLQRGGIKAVRLHRQRGNVLSQRLAIRLDGLGSGEDAYADTVMEHWATRQGLVCGQSRAEAITRGRFQIDEECLGRFEQKIVIDQDSPLIDVQIEIELKRELAPVPWREYVCSRWAWTDPTARRFADQLETRQPVRLERFTAPLAVEVEDDRSPTAMLPCGAAFHRQSAGNILDTLLIVAGEQRRSFRLAWVIDHGCALRWAQSLLVPVLAHPITKPLSTPTARFFALAPSHVVAWRIDPVYDKSGRISGSTWWVRETIGRDGQLELDSPHPLMTAALMDMTGQARQKLTPIDCRVSVPFRAFEIFGIQMEWANDGDHD